MRKHFGGAFILSSLIIIFSINCVSQYKQMHSSTQNLTSVQRIRYVYINIQMNMFIEIFTHTFVLFLITNYTLRAVLYSKQLNRDIFRSVSWTNLQKLSLQVIVPK